MSDDHNSVKANPPKLPSVEQAPFPTMWVARA